MDFIIGFITGIIIGGFAGLFIASLASISREADLREKMNDGCDEVMQETIEALKGKEEDKK